MKWELDARACSWHWAGALWLASILSFWQFVTIFPYSAWNDRKSGMLQLQHLLWPRYHDCKMLQVLCRTTSFPVVFWRRLPRMPRKSLAGAFRRGHQAWNVINCKTFLQGRLLAKLPQNARRCLDNENYCTSIIDKLLIPRFGFSNVSGRLQLPTAWLVFWWDA